MRSPTSPQRRGTVSLNLGGGGLPLPPVMAAGVSAYGPSSMAQNMAKSMTIEEMRHLHQRALSEAEAKRTELRLVLASRYRELVGSSDEVIKMKDRSQELHDLINALPDLVEKFANSLTHQNEEEILPELIDTEDATIRNIRLRHELSSLPRLIHRLLDQGNVHEATIQLMNLFGLIASQTGKYPLANQLTPNIPTAIPDPADLDPSIKAQLKMVYLQMMTLPGKIIRSAKRNLLRPASFGKMVMDPVAAAEKSAAALAAIDLLDVENRDPRYRAAKLLDIYFDSKSKLLVGLLEELTLPNQADGPAATHAVDADIVLSRIVLIMQYDIILHPHAIFCQKERFVSSASLPDFDVGLVRSKVSKFLASMVPRVRTKAKSVLVNIAGTTAAALGQIRQSLYDKTDGAEVTKSPEWIEATKALVNTRDVFQADNAALDLHQRHFSLWSSLFSTTFSSLVNSLLNTVFGSVHSNVIATLTASLANAPSLASMQSHEAYRNTLKLAVDLDRALLKVSEDAHELLIHAEEREESERRLRQSLYVQTCEILGRLVHELRRMAASKEESDTNATKALIIGRLCFLLKFRLTALPKLLDPQSSPAALHQTLGMISFVDLQSAFELADDDEDGIIKISEALEAFESAFSGTQFRGAEMLRETLLLDHEGSKSTDWQDKDSLAVEKLDVTLPELTLLSARGLRHERSGPTTALGTFQVSLDAIVAKCFSDWAKYVAADSSQRLSEKICEFVHEACTETEEEFNRLHERVSPASAVSPHMICFILDLASILNRTVCPSDSISPVPSQSYAQAMGIDVTDGNILTIIDTVRLSLLRQCLCSVASALNESLHSSRASKSTLDSIYKSAASQLFLDVSFIKSFLVDRSRHPLDPGSEQFGVIQHVLEHCVQVGESPSINGVIQNVLMSCNLSLSSLLVEDKTPYSPARGESDVGIISDSASSPHFRMPLASSVRFNVLPVQADRSLNEIQLREKYTKEKEVPRPESLGGSVMSSGLGFMSTGLGFFKKT